MNSPRIDDLFDRYLDGHLEDGEVTELQLVLATPTGRARWRLLTRLEGELMQQLSAPASLAPSAPDNRKNRLFPFACAAALAATLLVGWLILDRSEPAGAKILEQHGSVMVEDDGKTRPVREQDILHDGESITTSGEAATAVRFADGTRLQLLGDSHLQLLAGTPAKRLYLRSGTLAAQVAPQLPGHPLTIATPQALVTVIGTTFSVRVGDRKTTVSVEHGLVRLARSDGSGSIPLAAGNLGVVAEGAAPALGEPVAARDAALWPFRADDPWNTSLGSEARYAPVDSPALTRSHLVLNVSTWSQPIAIATAADPHYRVVLRDDSQQPRLIRFPAVTRPDPSADAFLNVIDESHRWALELYHARLRGETIEVDDAALIDLQGAGFGLGLKAITTFGGSAIGGVIRRGELLQGINHALILGAPRSALNRQTEDRRSFVWPATAADDDAAETYGANGNVFLGSLLAIPADVDVHRLAAPGPALEILRALQDYGGYVLEVTDAGDPAAREPGFMSMTIEPGAAPEVPPDLAETLSACLGALRVVDNNTLKNPGGGGTRHRRPAPPPFAPPP